MLSFTKNRDRPQNRKVCLTTPLHAISRRKCVSEITFIEFLAASVVGFFRKVLWATQTENAHDQVL